MNKELKEFIAELNASNSSLCKRAATTLSRLGSIEQELVNTQIVATEIQDLMSGVSEFIENLDCVPHIDEIKAFNACLEIGNKIRDLDLPEFTQEHSQPVCFANKGDSESNMQSDMVVDYAMEMIDAEDEDNANVRSVVERMIAAGYTITATCDPVGFDD